MSRINYYFAFFHSYITNMFLLYFVVLFLNIHNGKPPLLLPYIIIILTVLIAGWIIAHHFKLRYIYIILPIVLVAAMMLDFYWLSSLFLGFISILRFEYLYGDIEDTLAAPSIIITFILLLGVNVLGTETDSSFQVEYHLLFVSQLLFYFIGRIVHLLLANPYVQKGKLTAFLGLSGIFITLGIMLSIAYNYAVYSLQYIVVVLLGGMVYILKPFFSFLEGVEFEPPEPLDRENLEQGEGEENMEAIQAESPTSQIPVDTLMTILLLLVIGIGVYYFYKKREAPTGHSTGEVEKKRATIVHSPLEETHVKREVPKNRVRKLYYSFEKWLAAKGWGRYRDETIEEWVHRCRLADIIDPAELEIYRKTRYMDQEISESEYREYKYAIDHMKKMIMNHKKKQE